jgi:hypothetical protein
VISRITAASAGPSRLISTATPYNRPIVGTCH